MSTIDPKTFYNTKMPSKYGSSYERGRWERTAFERAQYHMMESIMNCLVIPFMRGPLRVLEIGPGPGTWTKFLQKGEPNASFTLVDISSVMLEQARAALTGSIEFFENDWISYSPKEDTYDFFFSSRALEYVEDKDKAIATVAQALTQKGRGVIITKTPKPLLNRIRGRKSAFHSKQISPRALATLLRKQGFSIHKIRPATVTIPLIGSPLLNRIAFSILWRIPLIPPLSESYAVFFEKS